MKALNISVDSGTSSPAGDFLAVSIGNTRIASGLFAGDQLTKVWYQSTSSASIAASTLIQHPRSTYVGICSVVPTATRIITQTLSANGISYYEVGTQKPHPLKDVYPSLGADRLANAVAAWAYYGGNHPVAAIDYGTATTLQAVLPDGTFAGGLICLGLGKILSALHMETALLPEVGLSDDTEHIPELALDTEQAIVSGVILTHVGLSRTWIDLVKRKLGNDTVVIATGGWSKTLGNYFDSFDYIDSGLTLKGIKALVPQAVKIR